MLECTYVQRLLMQGLLYYMEEFNVFTTTEIHVLCEISDFKYILFLSNVLVGCHFIEFSATNPPEQRLRCDLVSVQQSNKQKPHCMSVIYPSAQL